MEFENSVEHDILLKNAYRLGVGDRARDLKGLEQAIRQRLQELGYPEPVSCGHCGRKIPDFSVCPYCSAPRQTGEDGVPAAATPAAPKSAGLTFTALASSMSRPFFWGIVLLATAPMILNFVGLGEKWMFVLFSLFWAYVFFRIARIPGELWRQAGLAYVVTGVFALPLLVAWITVPPHLTEALVASDNGFARLAGFVFGVGLREELTKVLVVLWMVRFRIKGRPLIASPVQALVIGSVSGLGFAAIENIDYLERFQFLDKLHYTFGFYADNLSFRGSMSRVMLTPFVHAVWAGVLSYYAALALQARGVAGWKLFGTGLALAAGLHGLYDFFSTLRGGEVFVLAVVALSFAVWYACYEQSRLRSVSR